jgi:uncharacterized protein YdaU (DUF1376 family)
VSKVRRVDFNPDEFLAGVFGLMNPHQFSTWWLVCTYCYSEGRAIKEDDHLHDKIARAVKMRRPDVARAIDFLVSIDKLQREQREGATWLSQKRVEKELKAARKRIEGPAKPPEGPSKPTRTELKYQQNQATISDTPEIVSEAPASLTISTNTTTIDNYSTGAGPLSPLDLTCIQDFDAILIEVFGPEQARLCPNALDLITARGWIEQGVQRSTWQAVFRARQLQRKTGGLAPINALTYFNGQRGQPGPGAMLEAHQFATRPAPAAPTHFGGATRHDRTAAPARNGFVQVLQGMTEARDED